MIQHLHSILCIRSIIDQSTGMASYIDIIEGLTLQDTDQLQLPPFTLVSKFWVKNGLQDDQTLQVEVSRKITDKQKRHILKVMDFSLDEKGTNILLQLSIENLVLEKIGIWEIEVRWRIMGSKNWKKGTTIPLNISIEK